MKPRFIMLAFCLLALTAVAQPVGVPMACQQGMCVMSEQSVDVLQRYIRYLEARARECPRT